MKKSQYFLCFTAIIMILLAGCESNADNASKDDSKDKKTEKDGSADYEEIEAFDLEGPVTNANFSLDEDGDTLFWGENDGGLGDDLRRNVWIDGKVKELDIEQYGQFPILSGSGHIIKNNTDWDAEVDERHSITEYDPSTDKTEGFMAKNDRDDILLPGHGTYLQEPRTYIHTVTNTKFDSDTYLWKIDSNEYVDLDFIKDIKHEAGEELTSYPRFFLSDDASMVYATVLNEGIFSYDVKAEKTEGLLLLDNVLPMDGYTTTLTSDEKYILYGIDDPDTEKISVTVHALDLDTKESIEISKGTKLFTLTNGNVVIIDENEVKLFDFETEKLETIHKIELEENQEIDNVTISLDGSTIAYGYTTEGEDDKEDTSHIKILRNK